MIILITGASHTGKTALSQKLLEKYEIAPGALGEVEFEIGGN